MSEDVKRKPRTYVPGVQRLMALPEIIDLRMLERQGLTRGTARLQASLWARAGMLKPAGPRTGIYYNLVRDNRGASAHLGALLVRQYATPVVIGASALNHHGWTTQMPRVLEVAVPVTRRRRRLLQIDGAIVVPRPLSWYRMIADHLSDGPYGLRVLEPQYALADAYRHKDVWVPDPDDIDLSDALEEHVSSLRKALEEMSVPEGEAEALLRELEPGSYGFSPHHN